MLVDRLVMLSDGCWFVVCHGCSLQRLRGVTLESTDRRLRLLLALFQSIHVEHALAATVKKLLLALHLLLPFLLLAFTLPHLLLLHGAALLLTLLERLQDGFARLEAHLAHGQTCVQNSDLVRGQLQREQTVAVSALSLSALCLRLIID